MLGTLDLFTGTVKQRERPRKSGSKASMRLAFRPRKINGVCFFCRKAFTAEDAHHALPMMAGWLHYKCYLDKHAVEAMEAKRMSALAAKAA